MLCRTSTFSFETNSRRKRQRLRSHTSRSSRNAARDSGVAFSSVRFCVLSGKGKRHSSPIRGIDGSCFLEIAASLNKMEKGLVDNPMTVGRNARLNEFSVQARIDFINCRTNHGVKKVAYGQGRSSENCCNEPLALVIFESLRQRFPIARRCRRHEATSFPDNLLLGRTVVTAGCYKDTA